MKAKKPNKARLEKELDKAWSMAIHARDVVCQKCGGTSALSAHHAFGRRHKATRWDLMNGTLLCYPHHLHWAHRDVAGFTYWFQQRVGEDQYLRLAEAHNMITKHTADDLNQMLENIRGLE
jgi:hypothetical protein